MADVTKAHGRHVVILAHPDPTSFNAAVAHAYCETVRECGQEAILRDLYAMNFDPVLRNDERPDRHGCEIAADVLAELEVIKGCDVVAFIYPIWFGLPPAMMKGYVDRVIGAGATPHQVQDRAAQGPLTAGHMISITTSGARDAWLDDEISTLSSYRQYRRRPARTLRRPASFRCPGEGADGMRDRCDRALWCGCAARDI
jgi:NAD(P)H dehydrogenase (quinone)